MIYLKKAALSIFIALAIATDVPTPWIPNPAFAQSDRAVQTVIAQGIGKDVESAAKNAAENALVQVVGSFIDVEKQLEKKTQIANGIRAEIKNIDAKTREYSQGSIQRFDLIDMSDDNGFVRVQAKVSVRIEDFRAYIRKVAEGETKIGGDISGRVSTEKQKAENLKGIIWDTIVKPIASGEVVHISLGKTSPIIETNYRDIFSKQFRGFCGGFDTTSTVVVPIKISLDSGFEANMLRKLRETAINYEPMLNVRYPCKEQGEGDVCLIVQDNPTNEIGDKYLLRQGWQADRAIHYRGLLMSDVIVSLKDHDGNIFWSSRSVRGRHPVTNCQPGSKDMRFFFVFPRSDNMSPGSQSLIMLRERTILIRRVAEGVLLLDVDEAIMKKAATLTVTYAQ